VLSPRGARFASIAFPPTVSVRSFRIGAAKAPGLSARALARSRGWKNYGCVTVPPEGIEIEAEISGGPPEFVLTDRTPGLPASGRALLAARPESAVPSQTGDASIVTRRIRF
jgi:hypothetical protein